MSSNATSSIDQALEISKASFCCNICTSAFDYWEDLEIHTGQHHVSDIVSKCSLCNFQSLNTDDLKMHIVIPATTTLGRFELVKALNMGKSLH